MHRPERKKPAAPNGRRFLGRRPAVPRSPRRPNSSDSGVVRPTPPPRRDIGGGILGRKSRNKPVPPQREQSRFAPLLDPAATRATGREGVPSLGLSEISTSPREAQRDGGWAKGHPTKQTGWRGAAPDPAATPRSRARSHSAPPSPEFMLRNPANGETGEGESSEGETRTRIRGGFKLEMARARQKKQVQQEKQRKSALKSSSTSPSKSKSKKTKSTRFATPDTVEKGGGDKGSMNDRQQAATRGVNEVADFRRTMKIMAAQRVADREAGLEVKLTHERGNFSIKKPLPLCVLGLTKAVKAIAMGPEHGILLTTAGVVCSWGVGDSGALGLGPDVRLCVEPTPIRDSPVARLVRAGDKQSALVTPEGELFSWGWGSNGDECLWSPVSQSWRFEETTRCKDAALGRRHVIYLTTFGKVYSWGTNEHCCLGTPKFPKDSSVKVPQQVTCSGLGRDELIAVDAYSCNSAAVSSTGRVFVWGERWQEQETGNLLFGDPDWVKPVEVLYRSAAEAEGAKSTTMRHRITSLALGEHCLTVLDELGHVFCVGNGRLGQLGDGSRSSSSTLIPITFTVSVEEHDDIQASNVESKKGSLRGKGDLIDTEVAIKSITSGSSVTFALSENGIMFMWGSMMQSGRRRTVAYPRAVSELSCQNVSQMGVMKYDVVVAFGVGTSKNIAFTSFSPPLVKSGTLEGLVSHMMDPSSTDEFLYTVFLMYRTFTTGETLLRLLKRHYDRALRTNNASQQWRSILLVERWLKQRSTSHDDFGERSMFDAMYSFLTDLKGDTAKRRGVLMTMLLSDPPAPSSLAFANPPDEVTRAELVKSLWSNASARKIAEQLCLVEHFFLSAISPQELLGQKWAKNDGAGAPNVRRLTTRFNAASAWLTTEIVTSKDDRLRSLKANKAVDVMSECLQLNNLFTLQWMYASLESVPVCKLRNMKRCKLTRSSEAFLSQWKENLMVDNSAGYRALLGDAIRQDLPALPYLGCHQKDLTFMEDGMPDTLTNDHINFDKCLMLGRVVSTIEYLQSKPYPFKHDPALYGILLHLSGLPERTMDAIVRKIAAKESFNALLQEPARRRFASRDGLGSFSMARFSKEGLLVRLERQAQTTPRLPVWITWSANLGDASSSVRTTSGAYVSYRDAFVASKAIEVTLDRVLRDWPTTPQERRALELLLRQCLDPSLSSDDAHQIAVALEAKANSKPDDREIDRIVHLFGALKDFESVHVALNEAKIIADTFEAPKVSGASDADATTAALNVCGKFLSLWTAYTEARKQALPALTGGLCVDPVRVLGPKMAMSVTQRNASNDIEAKAQKAQALAVRLERDLEKLLKDEQDLMQRLQEVRSKQASVRQRLAEAREQSVPSAMTPRGGSAVVPSGEATAAGVQTLCTLHDKANAHLSVLKRDAVVIDTARRMMGDTLATVVETLRCERQTFIDGKAIDDQSAWINARENFNAIQDQVKALRESMEQNEPALASALSNSIDAALDLTLPQPKPKS